MEDPDNPGYCLTEIIDNVDPEDWFSSAAPNLKVALYVEGLLVDNDDGTSSYSYDGIDVSLLLYNSDGTLADFAYTSASDSLYQEIVMPDSGDFFIVVKSNTGHSKYVLQLPPMILEQVLNKVLIILQIVDLYLIYLLDQLLIQKLTHLIY